MRSSFLASLPPFLPPPERGEAEGTVPQRGAWLAVRCHQKHPLGWGGVRNLVNPLSVHICYRGGGSSCCEPSQRGSVHPCLEEPKLLITVCHHQEDERWGFGLSNHGGNVPPSYSTPNLSSALPLQHVRHFELQ